MFQELDGVVENLPALIDEEDLLFGGKCYEHSLQR